ncbi:HdeD family acid-resistance protein [Aggregicoccus sp. 17bor-14]|uniref:HdeD family acid-resistance protein n=1 Tax=Myxococcaceae TaxID=31 RepID=UPI00129C66A1|nr:MULTISPECIES: HdeD family acid-resistance protein [Myxococcaceae]MBF5045296.1 HdeD family acid-resistance protein [Simulacricoccus sp. 17bor-14]MRI91037.1 HdeD family acid-resistance protein [Aggregicoccus sp. 17bor-14]
MEPNRAEREAAALSAVHEELLRHRGWFWALGLLLLVVGFWALRSSMATTLLSVLLLGWSLVIGGVAEVVHAFGARRSSGFTLHLLSGVLGAVVGLLVLRTPVGSALTLSLLAVGWFASSGLFRVVASLLNRQNGWLWETLNGAVSLVLAALVWRQLPGSALWLIGTFVGVELVFRGAAWIAFAIGLKDLEPEHARSA